MKVILQGIVGSHAYGLSTPESDIDQRGSFVLPTREILSLKGYQETVDQTDPDNCWHEVGKFIRLAAAANPNILELFYLEDYTILTDEGRMLVENRDAFLSQRVRNTYAGYAMAQVKRLQNREDGSFKSKLKKRYSKHARHIFRLLAQGAEILEEGRLTVKVSNPEELFAIGELPPEELIKRFEEEDAKFRDLKSDLPMEPDLDRIDQLLLSIRAKHW